MRFMMIVKADRTTEAGVLPGKADLEAMGKYNEALVQAGVLLDATGLQPSSKGARVSFPGGKPQVTDGPFAETKELIAGFWLIDVPSKADAIEWAKKIPSAHLPSNGRVPEVEIRQLFEVTDFPEVPPEVVEMETKFKAGRESQK
ncbi:MAG: YciI family protein [Betaproteobacteria bacterium]